MPPDVFKLPVTVRTYDTDATGVASLGALARYFQEAAALHAAAWGWGGDALVARGRAWVLSRLHLEAVRAPGWQEELAVVTWSRGPERLFFLRDFEMVTSAGEAIARGSSAWVLIDLASRRPVRARNEAVELPAFPDRRAVTLDVTLSLPEPAATGEPRFTTNARRSDLDVNGHVNNTRLLDLATDAVAPRVPTVMSAQFAAEVREGDAIAAALNGDTVALAVAGRECCRVRFRFD